MRKKLLSFIFVVGGLMGLTTPAGALSIAVDVDPGIAGIQSMRTVAQNSNFMVAIVVTDIVAPGLNAFEFDVDYDFTILTATSVGSGGFLLGIVFPVENDIAPPDVNFAEASTGARLGSGVLATIDLTAAGLGTSALDLNGVLLSANFGVPIPIDMGTFDGSITVLASQPVIPEPSTIVLFGTGLAGLAAWRMRKQHVR